MKINLTLDEKLKLLSGKNEWITETLDGKVPPVYMNDGPCGLRKVEYTDNGQKTVPSTAYPNPSHIASSWNKELAYKVGSYIADDCVEQNVDILLAPGVNIKRTPLCGRNFEYFSEDPHLAGVLAANYISGLQDNGVGATLKHFACNNAENYRHYQNSELDDRTMFEIYLEAFRIALSAKPWAVMCSYNMINGAYASENQKMLKNVLRERFGFDGLIMSDWGAVKDSAKALKATLDLRMPFDPDAEKELKAGLAAGYITEADVDNSINRFFELCDKIKNSKKIRKVKYDKQSRHQAAVEFAQEGVVLLKNDGILPFKAGASVTVIQDDYSSRAICGGGSAKLTTDYDIPTLSKALKQKGFDAKSNYHYNNDNTDDYRIVCVSTGANIETEGVDRDNLFIPQWQQQFILNAAKKQSVVVVIYCGSVVDVSAFADKVSAIVFAGFGGEGINEALSNIISGQVSPSGKLAETFPVNLQASNINKQSEIEHYVAYTERLNVGYRYFDAHPELVRYPFGFGLSYAEFEYSDLKITKTGETDFEVSYKIKNTSSVAAKEVSQLYVEDEYCTSQRPPKELKDFNKVEIKPGQTVTVKHKLDFMAFAYYNPTLGDWYVENGLFKIHIGASSQDIRLTGEVRIDRPYYTQYTQSNKW